MPRRRRRGRMATGARMPLWEEEEVEEEEDGGGDVMRMIPRGEISGAGEITRRGTDGGEARTTMTAWGEGPRMG